ncbi:MAG: hypothetical protein KC731_06250 [Myxococcales bacterium]|nr:hypothetical protein [Myxococcales bacterium]
MQRQLVALSGLLATLGLLACDGERDVPKDMHPYVDLGSETEPGPDQPVVECEEDEVRDCKVQLGGDHSTSNCFVGVQYCEEGAWGPCVEDDMDKTI